MAPPDARIGLRLREARERLRLSQAQAARKAGLDQPRLNEFENATRMPNVLVLQKLADLYDVSVDWLLGREVMDEFKDRWPEGYTVLRRSTHELTPEVRRAMLRVMEAFLDVERQRGEEPPPS